MEEAKDEIGEEVKKVLEGGEGEPFLAAAAQKTRLDAAMEGWKEAKETAYQALNDLKESQLVQNIKELFSNIGAFLDGWVLKTSVSVAQVTTAALADGVDKLWEGLKSAYDKIINYCSDKWEALKAYFTKQKESTGNFLTTLKEGIPKLPGKAVDAVAWTILKVAKLGKLIGNGINNALTATFKLGQKAAQEVAGAPQAAKEWAERRMEETEKKPVAGTT